MAVTDADLALIRQDIAALKTRTQLTASQANDLALQLASGIVVRRRILSSTPAINQGYGVVAVAGGVRLADSTGLGLVTIPSGVAIAGGQPDDFVYIATGGVRPAAETGLGAGIATAVGQDINGKLVRANDPTCLPGFYYGDCNTDGDLTVRVRTTSVISSAQTLAWTQANFYFSDAGSDNNVGDSSSSPIVSMAEYLRRTGPVRDLPQDTTLWPGNDRPTSDPLHQTVYNRNTSLRIFPLNLTVLRTGTVGSYLADNSATPEAALLQDVSNAVTFTQNTMGRMTSGPRAGNTSPVGTCNGFYIAKDLGSGLARIQSPTYRTAADLFNTYEFAPSVGETYEIVQPRKLTFAIQVTGDVATTKNPIDISFIQPPGGFITGDPVYLAQTSLGIQYFWCRFPLLFVSAQTTFMSCSFGALRNVADVVTSYHGLYTFGAIVQQVGKWSLNGKTLIQASGAWDFSEGGHIHQHSSSGALMIFDSTTTALKLVDGSIDLKAKIFGKNNTGMFLDLYGDAFAVDNGITVWNFQSSSNANGAYGAGAYDFRMNNSTQLPAMNPSTFAFDPALIDLTYAKLVAAFGAGGTGGFGGSIKHPVHGPAILRAF